MRGDIIKFLKQFIVIELQYHCKALEHLTKAFNSAKHCEKLVPISVEVECICFKYIFSAYNKKGLKPCLHVT